MTNNFEIRKLQKNNGVSYITIPPEFLKQLGAVHGDWFKITVEHDAIIIKKVK